MGFRVIKTAIAVLIAIFIAHGCSLKGETSAGLLAILGVEVTRKRSIQTIMARFLASVIGLAFASILFYGLGFQYWVLALYVLLAFPIIVHFGLKEGITTASVVVFRLFTGGVISTNMITNQIGLLFVGLGSAMLVNFVYMPPADEELLHTRRIIDDLFSSIFRQFATTLRDPSTITWAAEELVAADKALQDGMTTAKRMIENQVIHPNVEWTVYFFMRKNQLDCIKHMMHLLEQIYKKMPHAHIVSQLFDQLSQDVQAEFYTGRTEALLTKIKNQFKEMDLPQTREEFEIRSAILQLCQELSQYLNVAKKDKLRAKDA